MFCAFDFIAFSPAACSRGSATASDCRAAVNVDAMFDVAGMV